MSLKSSTNVVIYKEQGSVLIVAVWMMALLFLLTMSLAGRVNQELLFVKNSLKKMQARYLAWAGFQYAVAMIHEDSLDETSKLSDNIFACGVKLAQGQKPEDIFKDVSLGKGRFEVTTQRFNGKEPESFFGMSDEDGKLNLNALNLQNYGILKELLIIIGVPEQQALLIASAALDWRDEDAEPALGKAQNQNEEGPFGLLGQKWPAKNRPFDNRYELMFLNGMTPEIYQKLRPLVTVFPRRAERVQVNFATAPREVLFTLAHYFSGSLTNTSIDEGDSLAAKILAVRAGADKIDGTADDLLISEKQLNLTVPEASILRAMAQAQTPMSRFLSVHTAGFEAVDGHKKHIDAVLDRNDFTIVSWRAD